MVSFIVTKHCEESLVSIHYDVVLRHLLLKDFDALPHRILVKNNPLWRELPFEMTPYKLHLSLIHI